MLQCLSGHNEKVTPPLSIQIDMVVLLGHLPLASCRQSKLDNEKAWEQGQSIVIVIPNGLHCLSIYGKYFQLWFHGELNPFMGKWKVLRH